MRVLITGSTGSLGSNVVTAALARGLEVRALVRDPSKLVRRQGLEVVAGDARDSTTLRRAASGCDALFHLVNVSVARDWVKTTAVLLEASLDACRDSGARLVFPANVWVFGRGRPGARVNENQAHAPCSAMGEARRRKEERIRASGVRFVMLRLPEFYGPHVQTLTGPPLLRIAQHRTAFWFGRPDVDVEFAYMPDAAKALLTVGLADGVESEVFHLPGAEAITPRRFLALAAEIAGGGLVRTVPSWMVRAAAPFSRDARAFADIIHLWTEPVLLDGEKIARRFPALTTTSYREGLAATIGWLRDNPGARMYY